MRFGSTAILTKAVAIAAAIVPLASARAVTLEPASDWIISENPESCAVSRLFQFKGKQVLLKLENFDLGPGFRITAVSKDYRLDSSALTTGFLPGKRRPWGLPSRVSTPDGRKGISFNYGFVVEAEQRDLNAAKVDEGVETVRSLPELSRERELEVDRLFIGNVFSSDLVLRTGQMRAPMVIMRVCMAGLADRLGIDWPKLDLARSPAQPADPAGWRERLAASYPASMIQAKTGAVFDLVLTVEPSGEISRCAPFGQRPRPEFVAAACGIAAKERFQPALDANGDPIRGLHSSAVAYLPSPFPGRKIGSTVGILPSGDPRDNAGPSP